MSRIKCISSVVSYSHYLVTKYHLMVNKHLEVLYPSTRDLKTNFVLQPLLQGNMEQFLKNEYVNA